MTDRLDHGILNIPLAKRGDKAKVDRAAHKERRAQMARLRELIDGLPDERVIEMAAPFRKRKPSTARAELVRVLSTNIEAAIRSLEKD